MDCFFGFLSNVTNPSGSGQNRKRTELGKGRPLSFLPLSAVRDSSQFLLFYVVGFIGLHLQSASDKFNKTAMNIRGRKAAKPQKRQYQCLTKRKSI